MNRTISYLGVGVFLSGISTITVAQEVEPLVHTVSFDQTVNPRGAAGILNDIAENPNVVMALSAVAAYYGVSPEVVETGAAVISAMTKEPYQEERAYMVRPPHGYVLCKVVIPKNPDGSPDGSKAGRGHFGATLVGGRGRGLKVSIWTKRGQLGKGRSWFHIPVQLHYLSWDAYRNRDWSDRLCSPRGVLADYSWNNW
jgi:hypothetical protein